MTEPLDAHRAYRDELLRHGLLISMGVDGVLDYLRRNFDAEQP